MIPHEEQQQINLYELPIEYNKIFELRREPKNRFERRFLEREMRRLMKQVLKFTDSFLKQNEQLIDLNTEKYTELYEYTFTEYNKIFFNAIPQIESKVKPRFLKIKQHYFYDAFKPETE